MPNQWTRVRGTSMPAAQADRTKQITATLKNSVFQEACKRANIEAPSRRQASKWIRKRGIAFINKTVSKGV